MEKLSRVRKYEDLRKKIEGETNINENHPDKGFEPYTQTFNEFDPSIFKKMNDNEETYIPEREKKQEPIAGNTQANVGDFRNEYLDDFINEVREYNIMKGNRESDNTQIDILNQLHAVNHPKRAEYVEPIQEMQETYEQPYSQFNQFDRDDIATQVKNLIQEQPVDQITDTSSSDAQDLSFDTHTQELYGMNMMSSKKELPIHLEQTLPKEKNLTLNSATFQPNHSLQSQASQTQMLNVSGMSAQPAMSEKPLQSIKNNKKSQVVSRKDDVIEAEKEKMLHQKLVEETQQLRVQLNEYEDDLNDLSEGVEKTNKMLNIILGFLILALLVIIGIIIFWIIQAGGVI